MTAPNRAPHLVAVAAVLAAVALAVAAPAVRAQDDPYLARAKAIMRETPLIDGHNDLAWEMRVQAWSSFDSADIAKPQPRFQTDIPRLRAGLLGAQFWSTYTPPDGAHPFHDGMEQGDLVHRMVERYPETFGLASTADDIVRLHREGKIGSLIGLEGGFMIENSLSLLRAFYRDGVRYMTLTHTLSTDWADASTDSSRHGGLTRFGEEVVREMNRLGMLVDLSHTSDSTVWDALRVSEAPVIFSHSSSRHFVPHPRNLPDDLARAVTKNGGVIMVNFVPDFIYLPAYEWTARRDSLARRLLASSTDSAAMRDTVRAWMAANPMPAPPLSVVADEIEYLRDVAGVDHVGIGSDLDGLGDVTPVGLEDVSKYPALVAELLRRGWSDGDVKRVIGLNVLRVMREAERVAARLQKERGPSTATIEELDGGKR
jgi:membrane dipeptidase